MERKERSVDITTSIRISRTLHAKLQYLTSVLKGKTMSKLLEDAIDAQYPTIEQDMAEHERALAKLQKRTLSEGEDT